MMRRGLESVNTTLESGPASVETQLFYEREVRYCYKGLIR
jgi:hypothetical protein